MLKKIMEVLRDSSVHAIDELAKELNSDQESVLAALEHLEKLGYVINLSAPCAGQSCNNCNGCGASPHQAAGAIYAIR